MHPITVTLRPVHDADLDVGSIRVLEKCGFVRTGEARGHAAARGTEIAEFVYELRTTAV